MLYATGINYMHKFVIYLHSKWNLFSYIISVAAAIYRTDTTHFMITFALLQKRRVESYFIFIINPFSPKTKLSYSTFHPLEFATVIHSFKSQSAKEILMNIGSI